MHMKIIVEVLLLCTALDIAVGIPLWMLVKLRDRQEESAVGANSKRYGTYHKFPVIKNDANGSGANHQRCAGGTFTAGIGAAQTCALPCVR